MAKAGLSHCFCSVMKFRAWPPIAKIHWTRATWSLIPWVPLLVLRSPLHGESDAVLRRIKPIASRAGRANCCPSRVHKGGQRQRCGTCSTIFAGGYATSRRTWRSIGAPRHCSGSMPEADAPTYRNQPGNRPLTVAHVGQEKTVGPARNRQLAALLILADGHPRQRTCLTINSPVIKSQHQERGL